MAFATVWNANSTIFLRRFTALALTCSWNLAALSPDNQRRCDVISGHPVPSIPALRPLLLYLLGSFFLHPMFLHPVLL